MPNYVYSGFNVTSDPAEIDRFKRKMFRTVTSTDACTAGGNGGTEVILDFGAIIPMPSEVKYEEAWAVEHWGTKWNAFDLEFEEEEGHIHFQFTTAWDFPTPVSEALAAEFPRLVFSGSAYEENHEFELKGEFNGDNDWGHGAIEWALWITPDGMGVPANTVHENMSISIFDQPGVSRSSWSDDFDGRLDVVSIHPGPPTSRERLDAADICELSHKEGSSDEGMTIIVRSGSTVLILHYLDGHLLVGVPDDET